MYRKINNTICKKNKQVYNKAITKKIMLATSLVSLAVCSLSATKGVFAEDTNFQVNVRESLTVSISAPLYTPVGDAGSFLRNKYTLNVSSNNAQGFTASMYSVGDTNLTNRSLNNQTIPTLNSSSTRGAFPNNYWGYSLSHDIDDLDTVGWETDAGNDGGNYYPLVSTSANPITVLQSSSNGSGSQDIYFGTKASFSKASGTYSAIVVISVVSGVIDNTTNPITPDNPASPNLNTYVARYFPSPKGGSDNGVTTYTYKRRDYYAGTNTTTTEVSDGDNRNAYIGYNPPQGAKEESTSDINNESSLAAGLATTATVAAAAGMFFFILAKRREDDEDEEEEQNHIS